MTDREFSIGGTKLGPSAPALFLAEVGGFFGQDFELASRMVADVIAAARRVPQQPKRLTPDILHGGKIGLMCDTPETLQRKTPALATRTTGTWLKTQSPFLPLNGGLSSSIVYR